jgi:lipopolysaccharide transport system permease protein
MERPAVPPGTSSAPPAEQHEMIIEPKKGWIGLDWAEMVRYRELLYFLGWRDVKVRYKQTVMGVAWAVLQPLFNTILFTFIFGKFGKLKTDDLPPTVFFYSGMLLWTFFAAGVNQAGQSLVTQAHLMNKVYFPRLFVPTATVGVGLVDLFLSSLVFMGVLAYFQTGPDWTVVFLPLLLLSMIVGTLGMGYLIAALTVTYRDFKYIVPFVLQVLMFVSVTIAMSPPADAPAPRYQQYRWIFGLNPMAGPIDGLRSMLRGHWYPEIILTSAAVSVALFVVGLFYFRKAERRFADIA